MSGVNVAAGYALPPASTIADAALDHRVMRSVKDAEFAGGAVGNGSANDTAAFSAAVTAAAAGGYALFVPAGTYFLSSWTTKAVTAPLTLVGEGRDLAVIKGPGAGQSFLAATSDVSLRHLTVRDFLRGVDFSTSTTMKKGTFFRTKFFSLAASAIYETGTLNTTYGFNTISITQCWFEQISNVAVLLAQAVSDCTIHDNVFRTIAPRGVTVGRSSFAGQEFWKRITISHNKFVDLTGTSTTGVNAILAYGRQADIAFNHIENLHGIRSDQEHTGIYTKCRQCSIVGNTIRNIWVDVGGANQTYIHGRAITVKGADDDEGLGTGQPEGYGVRVIGNTLEQQEQGLGFGKGIRLYTPRVLVQGNRIYQFFYGIENNTNWARNEITIADNEIEGYLTDGTATPVPLSFGIWANIPTFLCRVSGNQILDYLTGIKLVGPPSTTIGTLKVHDNQIIMPTGGLNCLNLTTSSPVDDAEVYDNTLTGGTDYYGVIDATAPGIWTRLRMDNNVCSGGTGVQGWNFTSDGGSKLLRFLQRGIPVTTTDGTTYVQATQLRMLPNTAWRCRIRATAVDASLAHRAVYDIEYYRTYDGVTTPAVIGTDRTVAAVETDVTMDALCSFDTSGRIFFKVRGTAGVTLGWTVDATVESVGV